MCTKIPIQFFDEHTKVPIDILVRNSGFWYDDQDIDPPVVVSWQDMPKPSTKQEGTWWEVLLVIVATTLDHNWFQILSL